MKEWQRVEKWNVLKLPILFVQASRLFTKHLFLRSQSGTGKTATFSISVLQCLDIQVISEHVLKMFFN